MFINSTTEVKNVVSHTYAPQSFLLLNLTSAFSNEYIVQIIENPDWGVYYGHLDKSVETNRHFYPTKVEYNIEDHYTLRKVEIKE